MPLVIEDFDMEPGKDYVLIRDGPEADAEKLAVLTGKAEDLPSYLQSTTEAMYLYIHTDLTRGRDSGSVIRSDAISSWRRPTGHWSRPATTWPTISATQTTWNAIID